MKTEHACSCSIPHQMRIGVELDLAILSGTRTNTQMISTVETGLYCAEYSLTTETDYLQ